MKGEISMKAENAPTEPERIKIVTGSSTYSFTNSWVENEALKGVLAGLIAEDLNKLKNN